YMYLLELPEGDGAPAVAIAGATLRTKALWLSKSRRLLVEVDPAGEEVLGAPRSAAYGDRVPLLLGTLLQGADQELRVAAHEGDQVAEIVRDAARPDLKVRLVAPSFPRISRIRHVLPREGCRARAERALHE